MGATKVGGKNLIKTSLLSLKLVTFLVLSGISAVHILNSYQPFIWGLNFEEYRIISIVIPLISIIGPLIAGPLADKLAAKNTNSFGRSLRFLLAIFLILSAIFYALLFVIPPVKREEARRPEVSFSCDSTGAVIFQERCSELNEPCHNWKEKIGSLVLTNCTYTCQNPKQFENLYKPWVKGTPVPPTTETSAESDYHDYDEASSSVTESIRSDSLRLIDDLNIDDGLERISAEHRFGKRRKRQDVDVNFVPDKVYVEPPHLCTKGKNENGTDVIKHCHVYTVDTENLKVHVTLRTTNQEAQQQQQHQQSQNETENEEWCNYPLDGFQCNVPEAQAEWMKAYTNMSDCKPTVECEVVDPYDSPKSVLADSQCIKIEGDIDTTLWGYSVLRAIAEIWPLGALTLLNTAIIIAVRDTSEGRGEVCRQYVWGAIGYVIIIPTLQIGFSKSSDGSYDFALIAMIVAVVSFLVAAIVLLTSTRMPISPPEWWWHTKSGMLVYPMSAIRKYWPEMTLVAVVALIYGIFWGSIHSYFRFEYNDTEGLTAIALIFVLLLLFNQDKFIEYCGHSNILIAGFSLFIIRFTALAENIHWLNVTMEILEPLIIGMVWITCILYMRHVMPRKFTATGQALIVIMFWCLGKFFGALIGLAKDHRQPHNDHCMYHGLAIAALIISIIYFIMYNLVLAPRCAAKPQPAPIHLSQPALNGSGTATGGNTNSGSNGNYTPLRVYHNERGKKGQFRY
ncbi:uncharacterized protein LOC129613634 [Condylostylus longicornis]|uniref:uncharacterized protein LOC129613634 n=1 Tax=Condylostylus longicornis TaxID=2530218 RepID=UPI00244DAE09|nr:uncharacterized protein LOC129613634 [Condylostylus longicornis]XP_055383748.1 uncharacterized protein LOC129613634 [Condylostylus longicornis]